MGLQEKEKSFARAVLGIAIPVALQCMLQSSFSIIDQLMIGQLGSDPIDAIGLAGKFGSIYTVVISAVGSVAGIMISQYLGAKKDERANRSLLVNLLISLCIGVLFMAVSFLFAPILMSIYIKEPEVVELSAIYLRMLAFTFPALAFSTIFSTMLRSIERAVIPLVASFGAVLINTGLNYILIFGNLGAPRLEMKGAAIATIASAWVNCLVIFVGLMLCMLRRTKRIATEKLSKDEVQNYLMILLPILVNEFLWSLGENVYAGIYGHLGKESLAAMTLSYPIQGLLIGALSGLAGAAMVIIGKRLGASEFKEAFAESVKLILVSLLGAVLLSALLIVFGKYYIGFYQNVSEEARQIGRWILFAFAVVAPIKVLNMVLGGGVLRSGGDTKVIMIIDLIGTWGVGVPLGFLTAFVWKLPIYWVYFILSQEELVRLIIAFVIFFRRKWMKNLTTK